MKQLEGKLIAESILDRIKEEISNSSRMPGLAAVLVGDDEASKLYIDLKKKAAHRCGILFCDYLLPKDSPQEMVREVIEHLNGDDDIDGILVQLPLPENINKEELLNSIHPTKDVDGLTLKSRECLTEEKNCFVCPFPKAILQLLESSKENLIGKKAFVLANSYGFGKYMSDLLKIKGLQSSYGIFSSGENFSKEMKKSDIIISALGISGSIISENIKDGAILIDGGIEKKNGIILGDILVKDFEKRDVILSPVPGGVGPVTVACLIENVWLANKRKTL
ncbi:MAG: bifunctional 5,10-methylenetetrahydrofolate dehydrogenase/5,10-methenyltetrahydrofolate cyclohydrolase [Candidatus Moraniibacteriota bacterium]|nr:MAG: bifunctional 5,10-methylenetetrahydrofolate dehydrogenase/5,10-methenyltetrahydrofolate cyclohydrolase [Candidatus Moranbacteria bacterium]